MKFTINDVEWEIKFVDTETISKITNETLGTDFNFAYGLTLNPKSTIIINKDMNKEQQLHALKHELTHCYIWEFGLYHVDSFSEEMVCDLVASINNFINKVIENVEEKEYE